MKFLSVDERREYRIILEIDPGKFTMTKDKQKKLNTLVYNDMLLALTDDVSFGLVDEVRSTTYRDGDARTAWSKLM